MGKNRSPEVVEASPYDHHTTTAVAEPVGGGTGGAGEKQATRCRDPAFAFLLYGNVAAIAVIAIMYGADAFNAAISDTTAGENADSGYSYTGYMYATFALGGIAMLFTGITLPIMMCMPTLLIKVSLLMMLVLSGLMMAYMFVVGSIFGGIIGVSQLSSESCLVGCTCLFFFFVLFPLPYRVTHTHFVYLWAMGATIEFHQHSKPFRLKKKQRQYFS